MTHVAADVLSDLESRARRFDTPCGEGSLAWRCWGKGRPVILLHGGSGSWKHWVRNITQLAERFEVWAPDLPGCGDSAMPPSPATFDSLAHIVGDGFARLRPGGSYQVAGFSFGSVLAAYMAHLFPERIRQIIVINGHLIGPLLSQPRQMLTRWRDITDPQEFDRVMRDNLSILMLSNRCAIDDLAVSIYSADLRLARLRPVELMNARDNEILAKLRVPTVCIGGELDPIASPSIHDQIARLQAARPDVEAHVLAGTGHWAMYEAADEVNNLLGAAFARFA